MDAQAAAREFGDMGDIGGEDIYRGYVAYMYHIILYMIFSVYIYICNYLSNIIIIYYIIINRTHMSIVLIQKGLVLKGGGPRAGDKQLPDL